MPEATHSTRQCHLCEKTSKTNREFWTLTNYFGISGIVCASCFKKVEHNAKREPKQPTEYLMCLLKQSR